MRRWNLPQVNTKVMCAVLTAAMVMTGFTACGGSTTASAASTEASENKETIAPESTTESTESGEEKVESYLGQITAIDGNVISIALAEKPEAPNGEAPTGETDEGLLEHNKDLVAFLDGQAEDMLDEMTLTLSGDTMTITVNDDTIITIDGEDATLDELQVGDTVSFFLDGEIVTSLSVGMPEPTQPMQAPEQN